MHLNSLIAQHHRFGLSGYGFAQIPLRIIPLHIAAKRGNNNMHTNSVEKEKVKMMCSICRNSKCNAHVLIHSEIDIVMLCL